MPKRFLVTGGAGFIGSAVVRWLIERTNHEVLVVDALTYAGNLESLDPVADNARAGRDSLNVVADQTESPTSALDIADGIVAIVRTLRDKPEDETLYGTFHLAGTGQSSWAGFAEAIFAGARRRGAASSNVVPIPTSEYPTPAVRPKNSVLSTAQLFERYQIQLPPWELPLRRFSTA